MNDFERRRYRLQRLLRDHQLSDFLVSNPLHVTYLTGFTGESSLLILSGRRAVLVSDERFALQIAEECPELETAIRGPGKSTWREALDVVEKLGVRTLGVEARHLSIAQFDQLKEQAPAVDFAPKSGIIEGLRAIKDDHEVAAIRAAIGYGNRALAMFRAMLAAGDTEKTLAEAVESYIRRAGGSGVSFPTIVAMGDRSALPHCPPSLRRLEEVDFLLLDWGARGALYTSDLTRMVRSPLVREVRTRQRVESKLQKIYTVVLQAQARALALARPGAAVKDLDAAARGCIESAGFGNAFNHGLGHGIGLQVHEAPDIRASSMDVLQAGMVFTLEPGIYLPGTGGVRIEDNFLITPDGCEHLSSGVPNEW